MKQQKKLSLNKKTISNLDSFQMTLHLGGGTNQCINASDTSCFISAQGKGHTCGNGRSCAQRATCWTCV